MRKKIARFVSQVLMMTIPAAAALFLLPAGAAPAGAATFEFSSGGDEACIVFGGENGDFFGDGSDVKVEFMGAPIMAAFDPDEELSDSDIQKFPCRGYFLRVTSQASKEPQFYDLPDIPIGSGGPVFKRCDIDGDGTPEIFLFCGLGGTVGGGEIIITSLKGGERRELFNTGGAIIEDYEPDYDYYKGFVYPRLHSVLLPGFKIGLAVTDKCGSKYGYYRVDAILDLEPERKSDYTGYVFKTNGEPADKGHFEPYFDLGFRYADVADLDGDGNDEIYGAVPVNGTSNADEFAYVNIAYKWTGGDWKVYAVSISDINSPLKGIPGVRK